MLTARASIGDNVMGLDGEADAYLVKPVDISAWLARVRVLAQRSHQWQGSIFRLGDLSLDLSTLTVKWQGQTAAIDSKHYFISIE
ncbi:response regulator transcription factor [Myxacorys almedinensis]|uniref:Response regulatory domain-containing protein n=1 Tax=Myxacorys almedinensis A TaxID=2690445 RepID=A0A8J7ZCR5_9CYAN|nr:response regulator transcription factor [Myxacorys almedinensis]NDJ19605.1 hypothetical protein [Myxacorys almedinensis A]